MIKTRILVTGYKGFIGRNMTSWLTQNNYHVDGWSWSESTMPDVAAYDWVIHLGARTDPHEQDVDTVLLRNFEFSQRLFEECNKHGTHLQYASTGDVYGPTRNFSEDAPCYPQTPYAWSKYLFDRWVFQQPLNIMVQGFRYFNVYGKWMHLKKNDINFMHTCRQQAKKLGYIEVGADADHIRQDWTWVGDICRVHTDFIQTVVGSGIWNVGSGLAHSLLDIAEAVADQEGVEVRETADTNYSNYHYSCANLKHLKETVGARAWLNVYQWLETE